MSTIAGLLGMLGDSQPRPWDVAQGSIAEGETGLLKLAEMRRQQETEARLRQYYAANPDAALGTAPPPGAPGAAPMTQQTIMPGQPPGAPQTVPGGQDLSRFATQGAPGQSTLASLGPAGQPQAPQVDPQAKLRELMRTNPDAAFAVMDQQTKRFTTQLAMREKTAEAFALRLQGVNSQESYESAVQDLMQFAPQQAARLPKVWSREAMQPIIDAALSAKDKATLDIDKVSAQAELQKARMSGRVATTDQYLKALGVLPGEEQPEDMQKALALQLRDQIAVSASHGSGQVFQTADGAYRLRPGSNTAEPLSMPGGQPLQPKPTQAEAETATFGNLARKGHEGATTLEQKGFKPGFWDKSADKLPLGMGNYLTSDEHQEYKGYVTDFAQAWLRKTSKGAITDDEWKLVDQRYFPQPGNSQAEIERKRQARADVIKELDAETRGTGRTGTQAPSTSQGTTGTGGQAPPASGAFRPLKEMSREERLAERDALRAKAGR